MDVPRSSGILLHISSLPGRFGIGDLGPSAYEFANLLSYADQQVWQVLPLVPVGYGYSPYASPSTFAGNPLLISPERLCEQGFLSPEDIASPPEFKSDCVDFEAVMSFKFSLLQKAFSCFEQRGTAEDREQFDAYCSANSDWLEDYASFTVLKYIHEGKKWTEWDPRYTCRDHKALEEFKTAHASGITMQKFWQYLFARQWSDLKAYCNERSIRIIGDLPIYVAHDSADVWANKELFQLDNNGLQAVVAGVPPDYFSKTGQRWGNPIYRWDLMEENNYSWWVRRFSSILKQVDIVRLDHFRGFEAYWEVPASESTAENGAWVKGPNSSLFETLQHELGDLPVIAENLGFITPEVVELMNKFDFPGMAILQFAFDGDTNSEFLPHNYPQHIIAYTGTHDNDTANGWFYMNSSTQDHETIKRSRNFARQYMNIPQDQHEGIHWPMIRTVMASVAQLVVIPMQDIMGLDSTGRMNTPGTVGPQNWAWRFTSDQVKQDHVEQLKRFTALYGRAPEPYRGEH